MARSTSSLVNSTEHRKNINKKQLEFNPIIITAEGQRLIINEVIKRARYVAGRATTCWKAHREGDELQTLVVKDSWQFPERGEEGELLCEATEKRVVNVARYYHYETVRVGGLNDDIENVRRGLDIAKATNYKPESSMPPPSTTGRRISRQSRSSNIAGQKRSSDTPLPPPPSKRTCSSSSTKSGRRNAGPNRVHRRVIVRDYGKAIYKASSRVALLEGLAGCIEDISINNLIINQNERNPSWRSFLIDLDLAVKEQREEASGARGKTGTRAFMAIEVLLDEQYSFMHDLESFFWVLFWICIHHDGPGKERVVSEFDKWNYAKTEELAKLKLGTVAKKAFFLKTVTDHFTPYYHSLIPWVNRLRRVVFPMDKPWENNEDTTLFSRMRGILQAASVDPEVSGVQS
ncbi:hypothetical protein AOQ84DRAFT_398643 [Glonium stellatum]|uniref:Fungal-type protein kinase domain-containing protein n=1 Tax=Glonium stellatum TaxID=574774 RepID=A0A8E2JRV9_9PEZI|nr:hypothetical protein AOQ84DRAFT_398643 [Glonium stellatum]